MAVITLTTDYGWRDPDSAGLRGRVYAEMLRTGTVAPVVDVTHSVQSRNLNEAAYIVRGAYRDFPEGSIHLVLVDSIYWPETPLIACALDGHFFLGLDNGLLAMLRPDLQPSQRIQLDLKNRLDCSTAESLLAAAAGTANWSPMPTKPGCSGGPKADRLSPAFADKKSASGGAPPASPRATCTFGPTDLTTLKSASTTAAATAPTAPHACWACVPETP
ncbi:MAG: SAM-dependent chlorinase/fluorinase [Cryomorphaceae bacterium]|nr:SAM-dependent chlorinase/fluorinase [Cryomorphaceae bacterium]